MSVFVRVSYCLDDHSFVIELEVRYCDATSFGFLFQHSLAIQGLFWFHTNFRIFSSISMKKVDGILIGIALNV